MPCRILLESLLGFQETFCCIMNTNTIDIYNVMNYGIRVCTNCIISNLHKLHNQSNHCRGYLESKYDSIYHIDSYL